MNINDVTPEQIKRLGARPLVELLSKLLNLEYHKHLFPDCKISVPFNIIVGDGGEDGRFECSDVKTSRWLTSKNILFQVKADELTPQGFYDEIYPKKKLKKKDKTLNDAIQRVLKPSVEKAIQNGYKYQVFTHHIFGSKKMYDDRIVEIRRAIKDAGYENESKNLEIEIYDANKIKDWVNDHFPAKIFIWNTLGESLPLGFSTWEQLDSYHNKFEYCLNEKLKTHISIIVNHVKNNHNVLRIIGLSGLGKSRLILEAFRVIDENDLELASYRDSILYCDVSDNDSLNYLKHHNDCDGIIILDNCDLDKHKRIEQEAKRTGCKLKFITIDFDIHPTTGESDYIQLDNSMFKDVVIGILKNTFGNQFTIEELQKIADYTEGYPKLAVTFAQYIIDNKVSNVSGLLDDNTVKTLVFGRGSENEKEYEIMKAISIFDAFTFPQEKDLLNYREDDKSKLWQHTNFIIQTLLNDKVDKKEFRKVCIKFQERGLIERRGNLLMVKPLPLALKLATDWWNEQLVDEVYDTFKEIFEDRVIAEHLAERLKYLDGVRNVKSIIEKLFDSINSPFGKAEVLNTNWGSRFFRAAVEVNPVAMTNTIWKVFGNMSKEELLQVKSGRRNLVWALERLCFRKETFHKAAKVLACFANAENENIGNNATGQFLQLFQVYLPNTEIELNPRLSIIDWCIEQEFTELALSAMRKGLQTTHFNKMGGAEQQGANLPLKDYQPNSWNEQWEYWENISHILFRIALDNTNELLQEKAQEIIGKKFEPILFSSSEYEKIKDVILAINALRKTKWEDLYRSIKLLLVNYKDKIEDKYKVLLFELEQLFLPTDIRDKIKSYITSPNYLFFDEDDYDRKEEAIKHKVKEIAIELCQNPALLYENLDTVCRGHQQMGYELGKNIAINGISLEFVENFIRTLIKIDKNEQNIVVLIGFFDNYSDKQSLSSYYDVFFNNDTVSHHCFNLIRYVNPNKKDIYQLFELIDSNKQPVRMFEYFEWGDFLEKEFTASELICLCNTIEKYGDEGKWQALAFYERFIRDKDINERSKKWETCRDAIKLLLSEHNFIENIAYHDYLAKHSWKDFVLSILKEKNENEFSKTITIFIIDNFRKFNIPRDSGIDENDIVIVLENLLENYFNDSWGIISEALLEDFSVYWNLKMKTSFEIFIPKKKIFLKGNQDIMFNWCKNNGYKAATRIIDFIPYTDEIDGKVIWHSFMKKLIDEFGNHEKFLDSLSAKIHSFGSVGSRVPNLKYRRNLISQLEDHKLKEVRKWVQGELDYFDQYIRREEISDEEEWFD